MKGCWAVRSDLQEGWKAFRKILAGHDLRGSIPAKHSGSRSVVHLHPERVLHLCHLSLPCKKGYMSGPMM